MSPDPPPAFIVGAARSGTTLLRVMLKRHSALAIPPESHFIPELWRRRDRYGRDDRLDRVDLFLHDLASHPRFARWELPIERVELELSEAVTPSFADGVGAAFRAYAKGHGKSRWADKTPDYAEHIPLLASMFPDARFVHLVRDGRDVALSVIELSKEHTGPRHPPQSTASAAFFWGRRMRRVASASRGVADRFATVRYEDLVKDPEPELRRLCAFLDLPFEPAMLEHDAEALETVPEAQRGIHQRIALPPTMGLRDFRTQMSPHDVEEFEAIAGRELARAGYAPAAHPGPVARARAWARVATFLLRWTALRRRRPT